MTIISFLSSWLKDIVVLFILITIAELIMPNGSMKKYINLIIGLLIIFTIISPIVKLMKFDFNLDEAVINYSKFDEIDSREILEFHDQQEKQIERMFKDKISGEVKKLIEDKSSYTVDSINVNILLEEENYGELDSLEIILKASNNLTEDKIAVEKVEKVELKKDTDEEIVEDESFVEIKDLVSDNFSVEKDRVTIRRKKGIGE